MFIKYLLPLSAVALLGVAAFYLTQQPPPPVDVPPPVEPPQSPYDEVVAGSAIVEPTNEEIDIGSPLPGVVVEVYVTEGAKVKPDDPLFRLDDRQLQGELVVRKAALASAQAEVEKLSQSPRPEELPVAEARVNAAKAEVADAQDALRRVTPLVERGVATEEELARRRQAVRRTQSLLEQTQAELDLLKAGTWRYDLEVAQAAVAAAQSQVRQVEIELERLTVRALAAGRVLQIDVRPGEFVGAPPGQPLVVLGDVETLHARVDIDEHDIPRFRQNAAAQGFVRGDAEAPISLRFVRVEPYVVPKRSLTGENTERVDTRVLQVIYLIEGKELLYVGQQLDVWIDATGLPPPTARPPRGVQSAAREGS